ncbi:MAG: hypothetical protein ACP5OG_02240 [Candidatus Nanoarchaeia archaeon]
MINKILTFLGLFIIMGVVYIYFTQPRTQELSYLPVEFSNLPEQLKEKINLAIDSLNSGDILAYAKTYDMQGTYDLITGKITDSNDEFLWFNDFTLDEYTAKNKELSKEDLEELEILKTKSFEDFSSYIIPKAFEDYFDETPLPKYSINSVLMHPSKKYVRVVLDVKRETGIISCKTDWVYYEGNWWQQDYFDGERLTAKGKRVNANPKQS